MRKNAQRGAAARCQAWLTKVTRNYEVSINHVTDISRNSFLTPAHLLKLSRVSSLLRLPFAVICLTLLPLNVFLQLKQGLFFPFVTRCCACPRYLYWSHKQKRLTVVCKVLWAPEVPESCQNGSWTLEAQILKKMLFLSEASWDVLVVKWGYCQNRLVGGEPAPQRSTCPDKWTFWLTDTERTKGWARLLCIFNNRGVNECLARGKFHDVLLFFSIVVMRVML